MRMGIIYIYIYIHIHNTRAHTHTCTYVLCAWDIHVYVYTVLRVGERVEQEALVPNELAEVYAVRRKLVWHMLR